MDIVVTQKNLNKALAACSRVSTSRGGLPVLNNILLRTTGKQLLVAATNLEIASVSKIGAKIDKQGDITVPAKLITEFISNLPDENITLSTKGSILHIECAGYSSVINGIDAEEFPELPTIDEKTSIQYKISTPEYKKSMEQVIFACSHDTSRPVLTGVYWHSHEGSLFIAGTDGYRLSEKKLIETTSELVAVVPSSTLQETLRLLGDDIDEVDILFDETQVRFRIGQAEVTSRLIDGKYPDYRQLIPAKSEIATTLSTSEISRTTKIASLFTRDSGGSITMVADEEKGEILIKSITSEIGENTSTITTEVKGSGQISLNSRYLQEVLSVVDSDKISLAFSGAIAPIVIRPETKEQNYLHIIMPLKS